MEYLSHAVGALILTCVCTDMLLRYSTSEPTFECSQAQKCTQLKMLIDECCAYTYNSTLIGGSMLHSCAVYSVQHTHC
jgi:hypothetical protein